MIKLISKIFSSKKNFLVFLIGINFIIHFPFLNLPPCSIHVWRQCNTLAVARNFSEESMNILKPRVDRRGNTDGITGTQFPAYEFVCACIYKFIGEHFFVARIFSLILFSLSIGLMYELIFFISSSHWAGVFGAWSFCWSPELFYHSINALPDVMALACAFGGLFCFLKWDQLRLNKYFLLSLFLITLGGLIKIQYLMFGGAIAAIVLRNVFANKYSVKNLIGLLTFAITAVGVTIAWYKYALGMIEKSNLRDFGIEFRPAENLDQAMKILKDNLVSDLPELFLNYAGTVLFITGIIAFIIHKKWKHWFFIPLLMVSLAYVIFHLIELNQMDAHQYYMMPSMFVLSIAMSYGAKLMWDKKWITLLVIILIAQPVLACIRILPARWLTENKAVPIELFNEDTRTELINAIPDKALCLSGPDETGCIYFYYLHKKGFGYEGSEMLDKKMYLEDCIKLGAKYIYTTDSTILQNPNLQQFFGRELKHVGDFRVMELKQ